MTDSDSTTCESCHSSLVQLDGSWLCPECDNIPGESFTLDGEETDFAL